MGLGTPLDKTKDHSKPKDPRAPPKVRPIGKPTAIFSLLAAVALDKGDKDVLERLSSPFQLATKGTSGCDIMSIVVQTFCSMYPGAVIILHDAANAYNTVGIVPIQHAISHTGARAMLRRFY